MKSLLVFIPKRFSEEEPGYMFGKIVQEDTGVKKFYIIGIHRISATERIKLNADIIGYYCGKVNGQEYPDRKYQDWITIGINKCVPQDNVNYEYDLKNIIVNNKAISPVLCHTVIIIYNQPVLRDTELFINKASSGNHFYELMKIVQDKHMQAEIQKKGKLTDFKETLLVNYMFLFFYLTLYLTKITNKLLPILKYSSLGLHINGWLENAKWTSITVIQNKKFTLKTGNYIFAVIIDIFLGIFLIEFLLHYLGDTSPSEVLLNNAETVVEALKNLINWLMGAPAGLKLNHALNNILGKFFLYHIHLWWTFLIFMKPVMDFAFEVLLLLGRLGITFQISIAADLLAIVSFHTYCIYVYAARLFNIQLKGITALFRLFLGKKKNPLRERIDSWQYQPNQLFIGTVLFTILLFLMPTTWVYYTVFTMLRLVLIAVGGFLTRLKFYLQVMPVYTFCKWLFHSHSACSTIDIKLNSNYMKEPMMLLMTMVVAPWSQTWRRCIPDTIVCHPPIKWNEIVNSIIWGELLYPL